MAKNPGTKDFKFILTDPKNLKLHPKNPRFHPDSAMDKLVASVEKFGFLNPIIVSKDGYVLAGNLRLKYALKKKVKKIPALMTNLSGSEAMAFMIADNRVQDESSWNTEILTELIQELSEFPMDLTVTGFTQDEIDGFTDWDTLEILETENFWDSGVDGSRNQASTRRGVVSMGNLSQAIEHELLDKVVETVNRNFGHYKEDTVLKFCEWLVNESGLRNK